ncbi:hypothetical protein ACKF11_13275 [Methylobacillus sp. Pita2]|uniref:hypothetical protein n=1 Tax=Methylobacillus sp. Pita2 TaxID=3383245 RepID=UPI0038B64751
MTASTLNQKFDCTMTRDDKGWGNIPLIQQFIEGNPEGDASVKPWLEARGLEGKFVSFCDDIDEESELGIAYIEHSDVSAWIPEAPDGGQDGKWTLASIYDHENGPYALFIRSNLSFPAETSFRSTELV